MRLAEHDSLAARKRTSMNTSYRWVVVAAGAFMGCVAIGSIFSLPVFLQPMAQATGWSRTAISAAMTINFLVMGLNSVQFGNRSPVRRAGGGSPREQQP